MNKNKKGLSKDKLNKVAGSGQSTWRDLPSELKLAIESSYIPNMDLDQSIPDDVTCTIKPGYIISGSPVSRNKGNKSN